MTTMQFRASAKGCAVIADTPQAAAIQFFNEFPSRRKCDVIEGVKDGHFFTVSYGKPWPKSWKDVTKKTAAELPGIA